MSRMRRRLNLLGSGIIVIVLMLVACLAHPAVARADSIILEDGTIVSVSYDPFPELFKWLGNVAAPFALGILLTLIVEVPIVTVSLWRSVRRGVLLALFLMIANVISYSWLFSVRDSLGLMGEIPVTILEAACITGGYLYLFRDRHKEHTVAPLYVAGLVVIVNLASFLLGWLGGPVLRRWLGL